MQHFSNAGFPCPIMQSPSDHFLRAINTDFDRIIAMCKTWQVTAFVVLSVSYFVRYILNINHSYTYSFQFKFNRTTMGNFQMLIWTPL